MVNVGNTRRAIGIGSVICLLLLFSGCSSSSPQINRQLVRQSSGKPQIVTKAAGRR